MPQAPKPDWSITIWPVATVSGQHQPKRKPPIWQVLCLGPFMPAVRTPPSKMQTMLEVATGMGLVSALLLAVGIVAWFMLLRGGELYRPEGPGNSRRIRIASELIAIAFCVGAVAAVLAISGFIAG